MPLDVDALRRIAASLGESPSHLLHTCAQGLIRRCAEPVPIGGLTAPIGAVVFNTALLPRRPDTKCRSELRQRPRERFPCLRHTAATTIAREIVDAIARIVLHQCEARELLDFYALGDIHERIRCRAVCEQRAGRRPSSYRRKYACAVSNMSFFLHSSK